VAPDLLNHVRSAPPRTLDMLMFLVRLSEIALVTLMFSALT
jgi:hypothetical protein